MQFSTLIFAVLPTLAVAASDFEILTWTCADGIPDSPSWGHTTVRLTGEGGCSGCQLLGDGDLSGPHPYYECKEPSSWKFFEEQHTFEAIDPNGNVHVGACEQINNQDVCNQPGYACAINVGWACQQLT
ncbi:hypothetical protein F4808DRAFT_440330 [Astrocystis sublimbata]|nr:hypothetical protein F4808DRAFT_440330 [Astrocystis sublimbata]